MHHLSCTYIIEESEAKYGNPRYESHFTCFYFSIAPLSEKFHHKLLLELPSNSGHNKILSR